MYLAYRHAWQR